MFKMIYMVLIIFTSITLAQIDTSDFYEKLDKRYFHLSGADIKNISTWVSSDHFNNYIQRFNTNEVFPIEIIWLNPDKLFFIRRALPDVPDSLSIELENMQTDLLKELGPVFMDWKRIYVGSFLSEFSPGHHFYVHSDTIFVTYERSEGDTNIQVSCLYNLNGKCLKIIHHEIGKDKKSILYPSYKTFGQKWICSEWETHIYERAELKSIYTAKQQLQLIEKIYFPEKLTVNIMMGEHKKARNECEYYFRNIRIDRDLTILN